MSGAATEGGRRAWYTKATMICYVFDFSPSPEKFSATLLVFVLVVVVVSLASWVPFLGALLVLVAALASTETATLKQHSIHLEREILRFCRFDRS